MSTSPSYTLRNRRVWVAGHRGLVGQALLRRLQGEECEVLTAARDQVDLRAPDQVERWMSATRPQTVFVAAGLVGGIYANDTRPAEFLYDNLMIQANVVEAARRHGVEKLMILGSSCIYPRLAPQPMSEEALLTGPLEPTNQWYAMAKIAGIKLAQSYRRQYGCDFISVMPTNLYGPGDNFSPTQSHVVPALIVKAHDAVRQHAPTIDIWGTGVAKREFLHVDDAADGMIFLMKNYSAEPHVNLGTGAEVSVAELAELICRVADFRGQLRFDASKPDGAPRKVLDVSRINGLGWQARIPLQAGIEEAYRWYVDNISGQNRRAVA